MVKKYIVHFTHGYVTVRASYPKQARERARRIAKTLPKHMFDIRSAHGRILSVERG